MSPDVNPFEPWRPREDPPAEPVEPPREVDPVTPWRPTRRPVNEASGPQGPDVVPPRPLVSLEWPPPRERPSGNAALLWLSVVLMVSCLVALSYLGGTHITRVAAAGAALWWGCLMALTLARRSRRRVRLGWVAAGLATAAAAWAFVPTTGGINLVTAQRLRAEVEELPAGDLGRFQQTAPQRRRLLREYPTFRNDVAEAEGRWGRQTVTVVVKEADHLANSKEPRAALRRLGELEDAFRDRELVSLASAPVQEARSRVVRSWLADEEASLVRLIENKDFGALPAACQRVETMLGGEARKAGLEGEVSLHLREVRRRGVRAQARAGEEELLKLFNARNYVEVSRRGAPLVRQLNEQVRAVGADADLTRPLQTVRARAIEARLASALAHLEALLREEDFAGVAAEGKRFGEELSPEALDVGRGEVAQRLREVRARSLAAWGAKARAQLEVLLAKGELAEVAVRGGRYTNDLKAEALALGQPRELERLRELRKKALGERARKAVAGLEALVLRGELAKVPAAGELALKDLAGEAQAIGNLPAVREQLLAVRRKALKGRLEAARSEALALVAKDRNGAAEQLGKRTEEALRAEARVVGAEGEVAAFRQACAVFGDLARKAKKGEGK